MTVVVGQREIEGGEEYYDEEIEVSGRHHRDVNDENSNTIMADELR